MAWFRRSCVNRTSRIPIHAHQKPSINDVNDGFSTKLLSARSSSTFVHRNRNRTDSAYSDQTESPMSISVKSAIVSFTSLSSSVYNDTATSNLLHNDAAVWRRHLLAAVISNATSSISNITDNTTDDSLGSLGDEISTSLSVVSEDFFNCTQSTSQAAGVVVAVGKSYPGDLFSDTQLYHDALCNK